MARYTGASCKLCRREGQSFSERRRCYTINVLLENRAGMHGQQRKKLSEYGLQLLKNEGSVYVLESQTKIL